MSIKNQIIVIILCFILGFFYLRGFIWGIKLYQLNNSAYKKRKKGETFKEWLSYSRYREEIPKAIRMLYYFILIFHPVAIITCAFIHFSELSQDFSQSLGYIIAVLVVFVDSAWMLIIHLLFTRIKPGYAYSRWIKKTRGQKKD
ncbi:MAG: hypothetical protein IKA64_00665 [Clostridia bacterium]|nr:hypothetical protein [Clostridia bacterium]